MEQIRSATVVHIMDEPDQVGSRRTDLVRLPAGAGTSLFAGWGVRI
ncbi:MAG TPA: hypothetical protein VEJ20_05415 [Candidatus Eremiobacteraceae bacterium]|nr:hypothetical protein [Candidatus Eremiobacteraceae bacterium]